MMHYACRVLLCLVVTLVSTGVKADIKIDPKMQLSAPIAPSGLGMAVVVGPGGQSHINKKNYFAYLLDLRTRRFIKVPGSENVSALGLSWRNQKGADELYMTLVDFRKQHVFSMLGVTEKGDTVFLKNEAKGVISRSFRWSPNGKVLAGCCVSEPGEGWTDGYLGVSYDGGQSVCVFEKLSCDVYTPPAWVNDEELYVYDSYYISDDSGGSLFKTIGRIHKVLLRGRKDIDTEKIIEGEGVRLYGVINNECVYRVNDNILVGSKKIYSSKKMAVIVSGNRIAIESSDETKIKVVSPHGNVLYEKPLNKEQHLYAFSSDAGRIFILENKKRILQWDIAENIEPMVVFEVSKLGVN